MEQSEALQTKQAAFTVAFKGILSSLRNLSKNFKETQIKDFEEERTRIKKLATDAIDEFLRLEIIEIGATEKLNERKRKHQRIIEEICSTEDDYNKDLWVLEEIWNTELTKSGVLTKNELEKMFGTLSQLISLSQELFGVLHKERDKPIEEQRFGVIFKTRVPFMRIYIDYCTRQVEVLEFLQNQKTTKLRESIEKILSTHPVLKMMGLDAWLIKPTQRVTKYRLFLKDLLSCTEKDHPDFDSLTKAENEMAEVLKEINTRTRERETLLFLSGKVTNLTWKTSSPPLDLVGSRSKLIRHGKVPVIISSKQEGSEPIKGNHAILFDNVFLVCLVSKDQWQVLDYFIPKDIPTVRFSDTPNIEFNINNSDKTLSLTCESKFEAKLWVDGFNLSNSDVQNAFHLKIKGKTLESLEVHPIRSNSVSDSTTKSERQQQITSNENATSEERKLLSSLSSPPPILIAQQLTRPVSAPGNRRRRRSEGIVFASDLSQSQQQRQTQTTSITETQIVLLNGNQQRINDSSDDLQQEMSNFANQTQETTNNNHNNGFGDLWNAIDPESKSQPISPVSSSPTTATTKKEHHIHHKKQHRKSMI